MKPTKKATIGRKSSRKKVADVTAKRGSPAKGAKGPESTAGTDKKKKQTGITVAVKDKSSVRDRKDKAQKVRVKSGAASIPEKVFTKKSVSSKKAAEKTGGAGKTTEAGRAAGPTEKLTKASPLSSRRRTGAAKTAGQSPVARKTAETGKSGTHVSEKKSSAQVFPKQAGSRRSTGKTQTTESRSAELPVGLRPPELPRQYGENEFFLIPVEPCVVYANWEITRNSLPSDEGVLEVRFYEVTQGQDGVSNAQPFLYITVSNMVGDAFFSIPVQGREIIAEIGHRGVDGYFLPILRSRKVLIPSSLEYDESGMTAKLPETGSYGSRPPDK